MHQKEMGMQKLTRDTGCSLSLFICLVHLLVISTYVSFLFEIRPFQALVSTAYFSGHQLAGLCAMLR